MLARACGLASSGVTLASLPADVDSASESVSIESLARAVGADAEAVETRYAGVDAMVRGAAPALVRVRVGASKGVEEDARRGWLVLLRSGRRSVVALGPNLVTRRVSHRDLAAVLRSEHESGLASRVDEVIANAGLRPSAQRRARTAVLREWLRDATIGDVWLLRASGETPLRRAAWRAGLPQRLATIIGAHAVQYSLLLAAWYVIGRGALEGRLESAWLLAWLLLLLTLVPFRMLTTWAQGTFAIGAGQLLKRRLLRGAMRLEPDEIRHCGAGQWLATVMESEAVEFLALSGGFLALAALVELALAVVVLGSGAGGGTAIALFLLWVALAGVAIVRFTLRLGRWMSHRLAMTHDLVEQMVGHRTRLAQQDPRHWHADEDEALDRYHGESRAMDRASVWVAPIAPRGWVAIGLATLAPSFVDGRATPAQLAVGAGGVLLGYLALARLASGMSYLASAFVAWRRVRPLFRAASRSMRPMEPRLAGAERGRRTSPQGQERRPVLEMRDVRFAYAGRGGEPVLRGCDLTIRDGERILVEGPSGGGKSTLVSILTGLREPDSGSLLLGGLDRTTLGGETWRSRVVSAAQFHENHVFTGTLAFNLLMGRAWPPRQGDLEDAETLCRELGLGPLLDRMPSGLQTIVGETGWQLSHGERSRLFIARALLQDADVVVLDESFAALDPASLRRAVDCVIARSRSLVTIAHP